MWELSLETRSRQCIADTSTGAQRSVRRLRAQPQPPRAGRRDLPQADAIVGVRLGAASPAMRLFGKKGPALDSASRRWLARSEQGLILEVCGGEV